MSNSVYLGGNGVSGVELNARMANRHGLIAGATGTGKTITLQVLAEQFSRLGVPVFMADVKGDLSGIAHPGQTSEKLQNRLKKIGLTSYSPQPNPVLFWDIHGQRGHPVRVTISDIGPMMLSNLLELNETQTGVLYTVFDLADENGMLLLDLKDLRAMLGWVDENKKTLGSEYGNISSASIGAIQRGLQILEEQGAQQFFGEPALSLNDLINVDFTGRGVISLLDVSAVISRSPRIYATFLLWLLAELFEQFPEVGDQDKPKLVLFFDEAHLLFDSAPKALLDKIEQVVRLIRSKGVGVYFVTQSPLDIPQEVLGQLGTRVQHALRAFTPRDQKAVRAAAETFRSNPAFDSQTAISELGTGEALVSVLNIDGSPTPVERILIRPPESRIGPLTDEERKVIINRSPVLGKYATAIDRESAYEILKQRVEHAKTTAVKNTQKSTVTDSKPAKRTSNRESASEALLKSAARAVGSQLGRKLVRGLLGSLLGGRK